MDNKKSVWFFKDFNYFTENTTYLIKQEILVSHPLLYQYNRTISFYTIIFLNHTVYFYSTVHLQKLSNTDLVESLTN